MHALMRDRAGSTLIDGLPTVCQGLGMYGNMSADSNNANNALTGATTLNIGLSVAMGKFCVLQFASQQKCLTYHTLYQMALAVPTCYPREKPSIRGLSITSP
jgi:hypothetical protein